MSLPGHEPKHTSRYTSHKDGVHKCDPRMSQKNQLLKVIILTGVMMVVEFIAGMMSNSISLISDAIHMFTHFVTMLISYLAIQLALKAVSPSKTFRYWRAEVLAALFNGIILIPMAAYILNEAYHRFNDPKDIDLDMMIIVGSIGLIVNIACAYFLKPGATKDLNMRSAFLHMMADSLSSVGVIIAGLVIFFTGWNMADPIIATLIAVMVLVWAVKLIRDSVTILLESVPGHITVTEVEDHIKAIPGVKDVHDLHLWVITSRMYALTAHVIVHGNKTIADTDDITNQINESLDARFDITHTCLQYEASDKDS